MNKAGNGKEIMFPVDITLKKQDFDFGLKFSDESTTQTLLWCINI